MGAGNSPRRLTRKGLGAGLGYPAITLADDAPQVSGFVFTSDRLDGPWDRLDEHKGVTNSSAQP